jgi:phage recombination protein Bet
MTTELAEVKRAPAIHWSDDQIKTICNTVARNATEDELKMFLHLSQTYGLDPFAKEIWFMKIKDKPTIMTSRDGYLKIANNSPDFEGIVSDVVYENDAFKKTTDGVDHQYGIKNRGNIVGAYALVYRRGIRFPVFVFSPFRDYNKGNEIWRSYPHAMILKVAESMALKRAFSLSGLVSREEMDIEDADTDTKPANVNHKPANGKRESVDTGIKDKTKQIFEEYLALLGNANHAKNAILKVTEGRGANDLTNDDINALYLDLSRRKYEDDPFAAHEDAEREAIRRESDDNFYSDYRADSAGRNETARSPESGGVSLYCADCAVKITNAEHTYSTSKFGRPLCRNCQNAARQSA